MMFAALTFTLASATFKANATMPTRTVHAQCGGANVSPELHWEGAPKGTRSIALIALDPDAPHPGGWYHWVAYNLPPSTHALPENATIPSGELGTTSFNQTGYGGPCPPAGKPHHYNFTLYALDRTVTGTHLTGPKLQAAMAGHILARSTLTGLYQTH